ncbi:MAG TPA: hypothetical protein VGD77_03825 [Gemmatimonadaceae bacterium]
MLARWLEDSARVESVVAQISLDSFAKLSIAAAESPADSVLQQALVCEQFRLVWEFGSSPVRVAAGRWRDTFRLSHPGLLERREGADLPGFVVGVNLCGVSRYTRPADERGAPVLMPDKRPTPMKLWRGQN